MNQAQLKPRRRVKYLLRDMFSVPRAAGTVNGTAAEPGPGTRVVVDTENKLSISGGRLVFAGGKAVPGEGDPAVRYSAVDRSIGRTILATLNNQDGGICWFGFDRDQISRIDDSVRMFQDKLLVTGGVDEDLIAGQIANGTDCQLALVLRSTGNLFLQKIGQDWFLLWPSVVDNSPTLYPGVANYNANFTADNLRITDLLTPWNDDYGIATQRLAGARASGNAYTHEPDCLIEFTVNSIPSDAFYFAFRRAGTGDYWFLSGLANGNIALLEKNNYVDTVRGSASAVMVNGCRIVLLLEGQTIRVYVNNVLRLTYSAAANYQTASDGEITYIGPGGAISDLVTWPRKIRGAALAALARV